ncbi:MAG: hypothetical protein ACRBG0_27580 [Lewinella sp.]|uniref:hypothetical protein n=1 Tax=Lewinella sp. TaxID=2004506 RepID=UPI003D6B2E30
MTAQETKKELLNMGGKEWNNHGKERVYITCDIFNKFTDRSYRLKDSNNKFFFDLAKNAIMRSYKGKKPTIEIQY